MSESEYGEEEVDGMYLGEYEGERNEAGERHGFGKATLKNNDIYEGSYVKGLREGEGTYKFKNGARYVGFYKANKKHGSGTFYYPDGSIYEGQGKYTYVNKDTYEGGWADDMRDGEGTYTYAQTGSVHVGRWERGQAHGAGELKHSNFRYQGGWTESATQGAGKFIFDLGCESHGEYLPVEKAQEEEEETPAPEPKWKFDHITPITLAEPLPA